MGVEAGKSPATRFPSQPPINGTLWVAGHRRDSAVRTTSRDTVDTAGDRNYGPASPTAAHPATETQLRVHSDCGTEHICKFW